jgi:SAM-dependent methyltransferase
MPACFLRSTGQVTLATLILSLACAKPSQDMSSKPEDDPHAEHGASDEHGHGHGHQGHHGHGQGDELNGHGYKGHRFDNPAEWTERFESPERLAWQKPDAVVASLGLAADAVVADIGAGTGYFAIRFAAAVPEGRVYAVDIEPNMVEWLTQRATKEGLANLVAVQGEAEGPNLPEAVDLVFMCNVFHHLAEPQAYYEAVAAKLRPGGRVVIVDFRKDNPEDAPGPPAAMRMRPEDVREHMQAAGYELVREDLELLEYQYVLEFERP